MPRFSAIDVGSNALRLRVVDVHRPEGDASQLGLRLPAEATWRDIATQRAAVRLGSEVFLTGKLTPASIGAACAALHDFKSAMDDAHVDAYRAIATSAVREASNSATLVERARREGGIDLEVIEGVEEARLIALAVARRVALSDMRALLVDVGGGSTELTLLDGGQHALSRSLPIGTVRLLETFASPRRAGDPPKTGAIDPRGARLLGEAVDRALGDALPRLQKARCDLLVGTGGSAETLADLCPVQGGVLHQRAIDVAAMHAFYRSSVRLTAAERRATYGLRPDRADTIVPATAIFARLADALGKTAIVVPGVGLKEGILDELALKHFQLWDATGQTSSVLEACAKVGRRYQFDEAHGMLVAALAASIFDDMQAVHGLAARDRLLLRAAAILHDVGDFVRYDGHHKHSYYLILNSDLIGLTPGEREIVANVARYHRKSLPDPAHSNFRDLGRDARAKVRALAAILRVADALDREHLGKVKLVRAGVDRERHALRLTVTGAENRELEEWSVRQKADLLRDVFDLDAVVDGAGDSVGDGVAAGTGE